MVSCDVCIRQIPIEFKRSMRFRGKPSMILVRQRLMSSAQFFSLSLLQLSLHLQKPGHVEQFHPQWTRHLIITEVPRSKYLPCRPSGSADTPRVDPYGRCPLHLAAGDGEVRCLRLLLEASHALEPRSPRFARARE